MNDRGPTLAEAGGPISRNYCAPCARRGVVRTASRLRFSTFEEGFTLPTAFVYVCGSHR